MEWAQKRYRKNIDVDDFFFFFLGKQRRMEKWEGGGEGKCPWEIPDRRALIFDGKKGKSRLPVSESDSGYNIMTLARWRSGILVPTREAPVFA